VSGAIRGTDDRPVVLVVEDDPTISDLLSYNLRRAGYEVQQESNGRAGLRAGLAPAVDLVLMDLMLPGLDGLTASRELKRRRPGLPLIMLTALGERDDTLKGFGAGADDYVTKPFDMDVLLARIQARLRPGAADRPRAVPAVSEAVLPVDITLDPDARQVCGERGRAALNRKEYDLLELLLGSPGHLFPREEIVERVWMHRYLPGSRTLDVHIRRLRKKLDEVSSLVAIETVRGMGYRVVLAGDETGELSRADREGRSPAPAD
jgi:two-component system, OmpR family, alkaline phosphatase synthesis response regulator PhoP